MKRKRNNKPNHDKQVNVKRLAIEFSRLPKPSFNIYIFSFHIRTRDKFSDLQWDSILVRQESICSRQYNISFISLCYNALLASRNHNFEPSRT